MAATDRRACRSICFVGGSVFNRAAKSVGGSELQVLNLAETLHDRYCWDVVLVGRRGTERGLDYTSLPGRVVSFLGGKRLKWYSWIGGLVLALIPIGSDVYYERGGNALTVGTALAAWMKRKPFVFAIASDLDCDETVWPAAAPGLGRRLRVLAMEWAIRSAALVLCQSRTQMEACERKWGVRPDRLVIVRNGHALVDGVEERSRGCVAWIGSLKPVKRPELYLELASVSRALPVRFVMAGTPFGAPWETWVENGARHDSEVEYRGALGHDEVVELLKDSVALVCTSVREGFPNTFIEAWMCETPVVSVGIDPDATLSELGLGILVDDLAAARNAIARLVEDETLARDIGRRARAYVEEQHDINKVAERLNGLLEGLLGPRE